MKKQAEPWADQKEEKMKLGVYNAILHDRPLLEALKIIAGLGLTGIEINTGGFLPPVHVPRMDEILTSDAARDEYLAIFEGSGVSIAGLNCNGNPLHPNPEIGEKHAEDIRRSIRLAHRLGQNRVVTMSGLPGGETGATVPNWIVNAWNSAALDVLDYQWEVAGKFWKEIDQLARELNVKVALELHPQNLVFNTADVYKLIHLTGATHVGVELDASHLFWQQMDPVAVVRELGPLVLQAAAKDVRINKENAALYGVLDNSFRRLSPDEHRTNLGADEWVNEWPENSAWDFVALGRGHDTAYWTEFLRALQEVDPNMLVNIEHEDVSLGPIEGLQVAAKVLRDADAALSASLTS
jgi:sugar phosphate isomerase/epimerase